MKFYGVGDNLAGDTDAAVRTITVPYASAQDTKILSFSEAYAATISTYTLTKWNAGANDFATPISGLSAEAAETKASNIGGAKYKLVVNFVSGGNETYYLELLGADTRTLSLDVDAGLTRGDYLDETGSVPALKIPQNLTIIDYIKSYKVTPVTPNASVLWHFETAGEKFDVESEINAAGEIIGAKNDGNAPVYGVLTNALTNVTATVKNEYGRTTQVLLFAGKATRTPVKFTLSPSVILTYNGVEYRSDAGTLTFFVGDTISLKAVGGDYGIFYRSGDKANPFVTTTADELEKSFTIPAGGIGRKIHFESTKPSDVTSSGITVGRENVLTSSVTLTSEQTVDADTTINLNGETLTIAPETTAEAGLKVEDGKTLTIEGGKLDVSNVNTAAIGADGTGKIVLKDVELTSSSRGIFAKGTGSGAVIEITGGSITSVDVGVQTFGSKDNKAVVTLNNVNITSKDDAVYMPSKNDVITINGGTLTGGMCGVEMRGGKLVMNGVTVNATATLDDRPTPPSGGSVLYGAALAVTPYMTTADGTYTVDVSATNCKFNGTMPIRVVIESESYNGVGNVINLTSCTGRTDAYIGNQDIQMSNNVNQDNFSIKSGNVELAPVAPAPAPLKSPADPQQISN